MSTLTVGKLTFHVETVLKSDKGRKTLLVTMGGKDYIARCFLLAYTEPGSGELEIQDTIAAYGRELSALGGLNHPRLPRQVDVESEDGVLDEIECKVLLLDYIEGQELQESLREKLEHGIDTTAFLKNVFEQIANALRYLHETRNQLHLDIHSSNIIVTPDGAAHLIDFEMSRRLIDETHSRSTVLRLDRRRVPREWAEKHGLGDRVDMSHDTLRSLAMPWLDLFQFGQVIDEMAKLADRGSHHSEIAYFQEIATLLTTYPSCQDVEDAQVQLLLSKASAAFLYPYGVPELTHDSHNVKHIALPGSRTFPKAGILGGIVEHPVFTRLMRVNQLTMVKHVYPGAEHKRGLHLMHSTALCRDLVQHLFADPTFRRMFDARGVRLLLVCTLLHDLNHIPFLHTLQEANVDGLTNRTIFDHVMNLRTDHLGNKIPSLADLLEESGLDPQAVWRVCFMSSRGQLRDPIEQFANSVIDSGVDIDKLSYLWLDSHYCGVPFGLGLDFSRLFRSARVSSDERRMPHLAYDERAFAAVESVIQTRLWNFRSVYWHKDNRALMAMFLHVVDRVFDSGVVSSDRFLRFSTFATEEDVLNWLDQQHQIRYGQAAITRGIDFARGKVAYRQAYEVRPERSAGQANLFEELSQMSRLRSNGSYRQIQLRVALADAISQEVKKASQAAVTPDEVLMDIPGRIINDYGGKTFVQQGFQYRIFTELSDSARALAEDYDRLAKRIRVFVSPRVAEALGVSDTDDGSAYWIGEWLVQYLNGEAGSRGDTAVT